MPGATSGPRNGIFSELYVPLASGVRAQAEGGIIFAPQVISNPFEKIFPGRMGEASEEDCAFSFLTTRRAFRRNGLCS